MIAFRISIFVLLLAVDCPAAEQAKGAAAHAPTPGFMLTILFNGADAGTPWIRVGLASTEKSVDLASWRDRPPFMSDYYHCSILSPKDTRNLRAFIAEQKEVASKRGLLNASRRSEFFVRVTDGDGTYSLSIGFDSGTLRFLKALKGVLSDESSGPVTRLMSQISFLDRRERSSTRVLPWVKGSVLHSATFLLAKPP